MNFHAHFLRFLLGYPAFASTPFHGLEHVRNQDNIVQFVLDLYYSDPSIAIASHKSNGEAHKEIHYTKILLNVASAFNTTKVSRTKNKSRMEASGLGRNFYLDFGAFNVTTNVARLVCPLEYELVTDCVNVLCENFTNVCPNNNGNTTSPGKHRIVAII